MDNQIEVYLPSSVRIASSSDDDRGSVKSLLKALAIMEAVGAAESPLRIAEVALMAGISRPTAHRIILTLIAEGYLVQDAQSERLSVGSSVLMLSASYLDRSRLRLEALPHLQLLANLTGERTNLGILHQNRVLYLAGVEKPSLPTIYTRFGKTAPVHCCSLGKAVLAHLPEKDVQAILAARPLVAQTANSIISMGLFLEELEATRKRGYATDHCEHTSNSCCIAATIFDSQNRAVGAIGVSARDIEPLLAHVSVLKHTAELISHVM